MFKLMAVSSEAAVFRIDCGQKQVHHQYKKRSIKVNMILTVLWSKQGFLENAARLLCSRAERYCPTRYS